MQEMGQRAVVLMPRGTHVSERHPITSGGWLHGLHSSEEGVERTLWFYAGMPEELFEKAPVNCCPLLNSVRWWDRATEPEAWFVGLRDRLYPPSTISV